MPPQPEVAEHRGFQRSVWRFQRHGWVILGLLLVAALAGLTGASGPLAYHTRVAGFGSVEAPRIARQGAMAEITLNLSAAQDGASLLLEPAFLAAFDVVSLQPAPMGQTATPQGLALPIRSRTALLQIRVLVRPRVAGWASYGLAVNGIPVAISSLVLP